MGHGKQTCAKVEESMDGHWKLHKSDFVVDFRAGRVWRWIGWGSEAPNHVGLYSPWCPGL
jgi:hypothetical protein